MIRGIPAVRSLGAALAAVEAPIAAALVNRWTAAAARWSAAAADLAAPAPPPTTTCDARRQQRAALDGQPLNFGDLGNGTIPQSRILLRSSTRNGKGSTGPRPGPVACRGHAVRSQAGIGRAQSCHTSSPHLTASWPYTRGAFSTVRGMSHRGPIVMPRFVAREGVLMAKHRSDDRPALTPPASTDQDWQEKIIRAKRAREHGKALREGKPTSFRASIGRSR